ncbi:MAG TPA: tetratricopeptide repeat protein [Pyrinomonadaceae bacterium]|jgi:tetratricopeptide (TPR) repeat protein|nr:tetratricopeptide repeat protein [Pyrinomonadaceae bacterium]
MKLKSALFVILTAFIFSFPVFSQKTARPAAAAARAITVASEPAATVWVDDVKRGVTDATGKLAGVKLSATSKVLRVRANGFKQATINLTAASRGMVRVNLQVTGDTAELLFQKAEALREKPGASEDDRRKAIDLYEQAIKVRPKFPEAYLGLARVYFDLKDTDSAMQQIVKARRDRPVFPEISAVEGRIYHEDIDDENAIKAYNRAIKEGRGYQPEAHTGLGLIYEEQEKYEEAIKEFKIAVSQLFDTEPVLYQLLGGLYEKTRNYKEAIKVYEQYLKAAPNSVEATAVRSMMEQLKKEIAQDGQPG